MYGQETLLSPFMLRLDLALHLVLVLAGLVNNRLGNKVANHELRRLPHRAVPQPTSFDIWVLLPDKCVNGGGAQRRRHDLGALGAQPRARVVAHLERRQGARLERAPPRLEEEVTVPAPRCFLPRSVPIPIPIPMLIPSPAPAAVLWVSRQRLIPAADTVVEAAGPASRRRVILLLLPVIVVAVVVTVTVTVGRGMWVLVVVVVAVM